MWTTLTQDLPDQSKFASYTPVYMYTCSAGQYFNILGILRYFIDSILYCGHFLILKYHIPIFIVFICECNGSSYSLDINTRVIL